MKESNGGERVNQLVDRQKINQEEREEDGMMMMIETVGVVSSGLQVQIKASHFVRTVPEVYFHHSGRL